MACTLKVCSSLTAHRVFQRDKKGGANLLIAGEAPGPVEIRCWNPEGLLVAHTEATPNAEGCFQGVMRLKTGGPYHFAVVSGSDRLEISPLWVGDLWLLMGQSNMEGKGHLVRHVAAKALPGVIMFDMNDEWCPAKEPLFDRDASIDPAHRPKSRQRQAPMTNPTCGAGLGIPFANRLMRETQVPQCLIPLARGGSRIESWSPALGRQKWDDQDNLYGPFLRKLDTTLKNGYAGSGPLAAGMLWYQGEADCKADDASLYLHRLKNLIEAVREDIQDPELPVHLVQIGRFTRLSEERNQSWPILRGLLTQAAQEFSNVTITPTHDLPLDDAIHIGADGLKILGQRMAHQVLLKGKAPVSITSLEWLAIDCLKVVFQGTTKLTSQGVARGFSIVNRKLIKTDVPYRIDLRDNAAILYFEPPTTRRGFLVLGDGANPVVNLLDDKEEPVLLSGFVPVPENPYGGQVDRENLRQAPSIQDAPFVPTYRLAPRPQWQFLDPLQYPSPENPFQKKMVSELPSILGFLEAPGEGLWLAETTLLCAFPRRVRFWFGSAERCAIMVNGELLFQADQPSRFPNRDQYFFEADLPEGPSVIKIVGYAYSYENRKLFGALRVETLPPPQPEMRVQ